jgi:8-oxo-dGTP pyrophosphatase MutT (NUDIX family)
MLLAPTGDPQARAGAWAPVCYNLRVRRELSAGGVVVRRLRGRWWLAAIRPMGKPEGTWALPKGLIEPGSSPEETALREVAEETGIEGRPAGKLGDVKYTYTASFRGGDGERVFKIVSFFLIRYRRGRIGDIPPEHAHEVAEARWLPLEEAPRLLAYKGERDMAAEALRRL